MTSPIARRGLLAAPFFALPAFGNDAASPIAELERRNGGRLGVIGVDTASGRHVGHRADELFPLCSTFKFLAAAFVLARVDRREEQRDRRVIFTAKDLVTYSPVTKEHVGSPGMPLAEICDAAVTLSDNTAGNLLLASFGGPPGLTAFARSLGDGATRLDRIETELNEARPGDPRDTTTPAAMVGTMQRLLVGGALSAASRDRLIGWLVASKTGARRLRAGLPADWRVGDKTGGGANGMANDIAITWPPGRAPILVAAYYTEASIADEGRNAVIAEVARRSWIASRAKAYSVRLESAGQNMPASSRSPLRAFPFGWNRERFRLNGNRSNGGSSVRPAGAGGTPSGFPGAAGRA